MATNSVSNTSYCTIHLTKDEYQKHQRLLYIGSVMSQLLSQNYFCHDRNSQLSYRDALREIENFLHDGQWYSALWNELAFDLNKIQGY